MRKSEFETMLTVGIESCRLALIRESDDHDLFYSGEMYDPADPRKIYLLELDEETFTLRSDLIFDEVIKRFFYVSKEKFEYSEINLKSALLTLCRIERKVYNILSKFNLRGFYTKADFIRHLIERVPQLELHGKAVKSHRSGKTYLTIRDDILHFEYKEEKAEGYMDISQKDMNEEVLQQCVELAISALKFEGR